METRIPTDILRKTDEGITCFEIESLRFPITDVTQYVLFDAEEIKQRQSVFRDIITHPELLEKYDALRQKVDDLSEFYRKSGDDRDNESIVYSIIKIQLFTDIIDYVSEVLYPLCEDKTIKSQSMIDLTLACVKISREKTYGNVKSWLCNIDSNLKGIKSITIGANLDAQLNVSEIGVASFNTSPYVGGGVVNTLFRDETPDDKYVCMISLGVSETKKLLGRSIVSINHELFNAMNTVFKSSLKKIRADIINMYKKDIVALSGLKDDLTYIIKTAQYMLYIKEKGGCLTFPTVGEEQNITGLYNPNLLIKAEMTEIVSNDVKMDENNRIFVITGPNSGGKTVYLDSIGLAQLFFQLGLPVPAVSAEMKPLKTIASLYVRNVTVNNGRLADEVGRLKECLDHISRDSLFLLDETFSSTSAFEGVFLAESLIKYLSDIGCYAVYVTHFHELSQRLTELNREEKYNIHMLTADNENGKRTYKIVPYHGFDSEKSLAREIVIENGLGFLFD